MVIDEGNSQFVAIAGRSAPLIEHLLPAHLDEFVQAIAAAVQRLRDETWS